MWDSGKGFVNRWTLTGAVVLAALVAIIALRSALKDEDSTPTAENAEVQTAHARSESTPAPITDIAQPPVYSPNVEPAELADMGNDIEPFRTEANGELAVNEQTRLTIEALIAHNEAGEVYGAVREQTENLTPAAARQAEELVDKFVSYQQALRQAYPPSNSPASEEDALRQLEGLHGLREAYFGAEVTRRFFGHEEAIAREMIELMRVENDPSLTPQQKLEQSEKLRERLPGLATVEKANRDSASKRDNNQQK
jgi:hypothetical protein